MDLCTMHYLFVILVALLGCASTAMAQFGGANDNSKQTFFMHDNLLTIKNASADALTLPIGPGYFGTLVVFDDLITLEPFPNSTELGRGRGLYLFDAHDNLGPGTEYAWTAYFDYKFDQVPPFTSITFEGFDRTTDETREISVIGGTGAFRYARGYATVSTYSSTGFARVLNITAQFMFSLI